jgi:hypothetical protein
MRNQQWRWATLFQPFANVYPFLSPEEQQALARFRLKRQLAPMAQAPPPMPTVVAGRMIQGPISSSTVLPGASPSQFAELAEIIRPENALKIALRESALAQQIRSSRAALTREEFREVFLALDAAQRLQRPVVVAALEEKVPRAKLLAVLRSRDPAWELSSNLVYESLIRRRPC